MPPIERAAYNPQRRFIMRASGLVALVGILSLGDGAPDQVEMKVAAVLPVRGGGAAVVLIDSTRSKALPIAVGGTEALSINLRLAKQHLGRPLTTAWPGALLRELGGKGVGAPGGVVSVRAR